MANIISVLDSDGNTALERELRAGVEQPVVRIDLTYSDQGGEGIAEVILRNISSNNTALDVKVSTSGFPLDNESNQTLAQEWDYQPLNTNEYTGTWRNTITIPEIPPGQVIKVRTRVLASANSNPTTYLGSMKIDYLRSSV